MLEPERPKIDYRKKTPAPPPDPAQFHQYIDPYPPPLRRTDDMPLIYNSDDNDDIADYRAATNAEYDRNAPRATLSAKAIILSSLALAVVLLALIAAANLAA